MSQEELQGITADDYTGVSGSHPMWYRVFQTVPGSNEHYLRLIIDTGGTQDTEITFGPLQATDIDLLAHTLGGTYCHYHENHEGPRYESGIAEGVPFQEEEA
jgi:hypothetical protein